MKPRILVAGVGNFFLGDDAFGVEVVQRLLRRAWPDAVRVVDYGIRGLDLAYALLDGYEVVLMIDAAPRGGPPGTLYVLEPSVPAEAEGAGMLIETHGMDPVKVLRLAAALGGPVGRLLLVGCEPGTSPAEDMEMEMSTPVRVAIEEAVPLVEALVGMLLRGERIEAN